MADRPPKTARRGVILVVVLVVIVMLSLAVYGFSRFMLAERKGTQQSLRQRQARLLAESGVEYLRITLMKEPDVVADLGGLYDNEDEFLGHIVTDGTYAMTGSGAGQQSGLRETVDNRDIGRFSVIAPRMNDDGVLTGESIRYGLEDESAKINLRWLLQAEKQSPGIGRSILLRLPGMTETIADSILDWMDEDSEPRDYGAEDDYYASMDPPYYTRNALPDSLDELLLVQGMTPKLLYGIDWNRNGLVDLGEPDEATLEEFDVSDGSLNLGLISYLTLDSRESNITPDGLEKINVNMEDLDELRTLLEERLDNQEWVDYIISYRESGGGSTQSGSSDLLSSLLGGTGTNAQGSDTGSSESTTINSLLDLVQSSSSSATEAATNVAAGATGGATSPFSDDIDEMRDYLPVLYDNLTTSDTPVVGRININQAPRAVLEMFLARNDDLTGMATEYGSQLDATSALAESVGMGSATSLSSFSAEEVIEGILAVRVSDPNLIEQDDMHYPFWPYTHGIVADLETMKQLEPYFCTQGAVFKATVVGRFDEKSPVVRLEAWLDATEPGKPAKVIRVRELSELGPGYAPDMLGADEYSRDSR